MEEAAKAIVSGSFDHLPVVSEDGRLMGIITAWDISKAVASGKISRVAEIMTRKVHSAQLDEPIELAARKLDTYSISALPVVDKENRVIGMITSNDLSRLLHGGDRNEANAPCRPRNCSLSIDSLGDPGDLCPGEYREGQHRRSKRRDCAGSIAGEVSRG